MFIASLCSLGDLAETGFDGNPEDTFSSHATSPGGSLLYSYIRRLGYFFFWGGGQNFEIQYFWGLSEKLTHHGV